MNITLTGGIPGGDLDAVSSKSWLHRALICAALSDGKTDIRCTRFGEDIQATINGLQALGADIGKMTDGLCVCGGLTAKEAVIDCRQSGSTLRFLLPLTAACGICADFICDPQLQSRPLLPLVTALEQNGCRITKTDTGYTCEGQLRAGTYTLPGDVSSQFVSGLLLALPLLSGDSRIVLTSELQSASYVRLTEAVQALFGIELRAEGNTFFISGGQTCHTPGSLTAEGDWSNAAPFLCMGAFSDDGITVYGLPHDTAQGDRAILNLLSRFGVEIQTGKRSVTASYGVMHGIDIDASDIPDLVPFLALLGTRAAGKTRIFGAHRLRGKETDRLKTTADTLNALGGKVEILPDGLEITGNTPFAGGTVSSYDDHRIAMLAAVAATLCKNPVELCGAEAVFKSYPDFYSDYLKLCR